MARYRSKRIVLFDGTSATSSTLTSQPHLVDDYERISVAWVDAPTSNLTIWTTFEDGLRGSTLSSQDGSAGSWSAITTITSAGIYTIDTPLRWIRATRSSSASTAECFLQLRT